MPEPGFARREAEQRRPRVGAKKGAHGGNMVSPVKRGGEAAYASSTLITSVVPGRFTAVPAVITTRSPSDT
jgi:hypothetical protein